ncbi:PIN domain-containing protein [Candidatus Bathyarchaeota archaeon]|nr:PIN domain-containing protein [Candidatus Bathyarchaeota archaeon]MBS7617362.1 PIN domain-containing protein [Candidatus Bathyarchaeota archaeon]
MRLLIPDTNVFVRLLLGLKYYEKLMGLIAQEKVRVLIHNIILAEAFSVLLKAKENQLFGRVDKERILLTRESRREVFENLLRRMVELRIDVVIVGRDEVDKMIEKVEDVCVSAFDALTLVIADYVEPDLIVTDDKLFKNRAGQRGYKICSEQELYKELAK